MCPSNRIVGLPTARKPPLLPVSTSSTALIAATSTPSSSAACLKSDSVRRKEAKDWALSQILSISIMDKTPLVDLFERTDFNNVKELDCPLFPGLFD